MLKGKVVLAGVRVCYLMNKRKKEKNLQEFLINVVLVFAEPCLGLFVWEPRYLANEKPIQSNIDMGW